MKRWMKWIALVAAACAVLVLAVCAISPNARLVVGLIMGHFLTNISPPPIAEGIILRDDTSNAALTAALERRFGPGTNEETLRLVLLRQGFKPLPPPPSDCLPAGQEPQLRRVYVRCYSTEHILRYEWSALVCRNAITVTWRPNDRREIVDVKGLYHSACL